MLTLRASQPITRANRLFAGFSSPRVTSRHCATMISTVLRSDPATSVTSRSRDRLEGCKMLARGTRLPPAVTLPSVRHAYSTSSFSAASLIADHPARPFGRHRAHT